MEKALYGTKKASRKAQQSLKNILENAGFVSLKSDPMVFLKINTRPYSIAIIAGWVDDLLCVGDRSMINQALKGLKDKNFDITIDESPKAYTGVQFDRDRKNRTMKVHQTEYARQLIWDRNMTGCRPVRSPIVNQSVEEALKECEERKNFVAADAKRREYQKACGSLIWLVKTRPDIAYAVGVLCRHMQNPIDRDFGRLKRVLQYVAHTTTLGYVWENKGRERLSLSMECNLISAHADSDFAGRVVDSRSTSGYSLKFGDTGTFLCVSRMQRQVSLSTTHAELVCACECAKTIEWIRGFVEELGFVITEPTIMYQDNNGAIELAKNPVYHFRTRHFRIAQHYLRELENDEVIRTVRESSEDMWADILNKPQPPVRHQMLRKQLMGE